MWQIHERREHGLTLYTNSEIIPLNPFLREFQFLREYESHWCPKFNLSIHLYTLKTTQWQSTGLTS